MSKGKAGMFLQKKIGFIFHRTAVYFININNNCSVYYVVKISDLKLS